MKPVLLAIVLVGIAVLLLGVKVFFVKGGRFPSGHVHSSPALRARGIECASSSKRNTRTIIHKPSNSDSPSK